MPVSQRIALGLAGVVAEQRRLGLTLREQLVEGEIQAALLTINLEAGHFLVLATHPRGEAIADCPASETNADAGQILDLDLERRAVRLVARRPRLAWRGVDTLDWGHQRTQQVEEV